MRRHARWGKIIGRTNDEYASISLKKANWAQATCFTCSPKLRTPSNLPTCGDERILVFGHGFSQAEKIPLRELERAADALRDGLGNVIRLGGLIRCGVLWRSRFPDSRECDATHDKKGSNTKKAHSSLRYSEAHSSLRYSEKDM